MSSCVIEQRSSSVYCSQTLDILYWSAGLIASHSVYAPLHALWSLLDVGCNLAQLLPQHAYLLHGIADVLWQPRSDLAPHNVGQLRAVAICADHDLQGPVAMHAAKVEVALGRYICDVGGNLLFLAQLEYLRRGFGVVDSGQDHVNAIEIGWFELAVDVIDLLLLNAVCDFIVEAVTWRDNGDFGVGVENVHDATSRDLLFGQSSIPAKRVMQCTYFSSTDNEYALVPYLPGEQEGASALDLWIWAFHRECGVRQNVTCMLRGEIRVDDSYYRRFPACCATPWRQSSYR